jgi:uncharacterized delta-60 repeat protein
MRAINRAAVAILTAAWFLAACGGGGEEEEQEPPAPVETVAEPWRFWTFSVRDAVGQSFSIVGGEQTGGEVLKTQDFTSLTPAPALPGTAARGEVYSSPSGNTYWVEAVAPNGNVVVPTDRIGGETILLQAQTFRKRAADARLSLLITEAFIEGRDFNGTDPALAHCPWAEGADTTVRCFDRVFGQLLMDVKVAELRESGAHLIRRHFNGGVQLIGWADNWGWSTFSLIRPEAAAAGLRPRPLFRSSQFDLVVFNGQQIAQPGADVRLRQPLRVELDLSAIPVDAEFGVWVEARALADNRRGRESSLKTRLRDPLSTGGTIFEATGLVAGSTQLSGEPVFQAPEQEQCNSGVGTGGGARGTVEFGSASYLIPEFGHPGPVIFITRSGGSSGTVVVNVSTSDGTAVADTHYTPITQRIVFHDGEDEPRAVSLSPIDDSVEGGDRFLSLHVAPEGACAELGSQDTATITIVDDEHQREEEFFAVGGTVTGLEGTGLVIREVVTGITLTPPNGSFTFDYRYSDAETYDVRIITQPTGPSQTCSITRGTGTIAGADARDIVVSCETPQIGTSLDASFGDNGKVITTLPTGRAAVLQPDGKIVVLAGLNLARFNPDGSPDTSFGTGGILSAPFNGVFGEEARDLALQSDGRILVVGYTRANPTIPNYDFAIRRFESNGDVDSSFGNGGLVTLDFFGQIDRAHRIAVLPDGRFVVGGHAGTLSGSGDLRHSFAVARYNADGSPDLSFVDRVGHTTAVGGFGLPTAMAIAPDGKIVMGGRHGADGAATTDLALARWGIDGEIDSAEDSDPNVWFGVDESGSGIDDLFGDDDDVADLLITADGRIMGALRSNDEGKYNFTLVELHEHWGHQDGRPPGFFASSVPIGTEDDLGTALVQQPDGKFVLAGQASGDFGIVRFNADRTVDQGFGDDGVLTVDFFGGGDGANDVLLQPDGKIVAIGIVRNGSSNVLGLVRIAPGGPGR